MNFINKKTGETLTLQQITDLNKEGKLINFTLTFGNIHQFHQEIRMIMQMNNGFRGLFARSRAVVKRSYEVLMHPNTNQIQRARALYDIARYDMIPQAMIGFFGNGKLPKELENWKPTFGVQWHFEAMQEIPRSDMQGNLYWQMEALKLYSQEQEALQAPSVEDIEIQVIESDSLWISYGGNTNAYKFNELSEFWDKKSNKPNIVAHIMIDLSLDVDGCLKQNNEYHNYFGKGKIDQSSKHISKLANALDSIITTDNLDQKSTNRWFKVSKHRDKVWTPRFIFRSSRTLEEKKILRNAVKNNHTVSKLAEDMIQSDYEKKWEKVEERNDLGFKVKTDKELGLEDYNSNKEIDFSD